MTDETSMDEVAVKRAYKRWAPIYDKTFGQIAAAGRKQAVKIINNRRNGRVLEVGVGTGLSLPSYSEHIKVTGIDLSPEMLERARSRVAKKGLKNVEGLHEMDAGRMSFDDDSFDVVVAMYVMTVVPEPEKVMAELERVTVPGGEVILVNHFSQEHGVRGFFERAIAPLGSILGWRPVFPMDRVTSQKGLELASRMPMWPLGLFTMVRFVKQAQPAQEREKPASRLQDADYFASREGAELREESAFSNT